MSDDRFYETATREVRRSAPAALRNREPIAQVLADWLPNEGLVLEIASGTGEHAAFFAERFPDLQWQPSDVHPDALGSIAAWQAASGLPNFKPPIVIDASAADWPVDHADALLSINMVHISPWASALGLLSGAAKVLDRGGALIIYGPWLQSGVQTAPSNLAFDEQLRQRNPEWGLRRVEHFETVAVERGFELERTTTTPANNLMLLFRLSL